MSAYNGERYIQQQIESVMEQSWREVSLFIRDDGSSDGTLKVIQRLAEQYQGRITWVQGGNLGVIGSFLELLKMSDETADYYCFCDQDDVWLPHKVESAVERLESDADQHRPLMHFTSTTLTDDRLHEQGNWPNPPAKKLSFYNALVQNVAVGATMTLNRTARHFFVNHDQPDVRHIIMHDWWFYMMVSAFGNVYYDLKPSMLYRQHGNNVVGGTNSLFRITLNKWSSFKKHAGKKILYHQALEFYRVYGHNLDADKKKQITWFLQSRGNWMDRVKYLKVSKLYRQSRGENLLFKILILIDYI
nr:glycosyltransferase family 2 protein [Paenibacillus sp. F411]